MKRLLILATVLLLAGCTAADRSRFGFGRMMSNYKVTLYSGGEAVRTWTSRGVVNSEGDNDGYHFVDNANGAIIEISGEVVVEEIR